MVELYNFILNNFSSDDVEMQYNIGFRLFFQVFIVRELFDIVFGMEGKIMNKIISLGNYGMIKIDI